MNKPVTNRRMKIGELARKTGKTVRALHLYEEMGLLKPGRSEGGFRLYGPDELARVYWIGKLQKMGFKLAQIQSLLDAVERSRTAPSAMDACRFCTVPHPAVAACTDCASDRHTVPRPSLVAGIHMKPDEVSSSDDGASTE